MTIQDPLQGGVQLPDMTNPSLPTFASTPGEAASVKEEEVPANEASDVPTGLLTMPLNAEGAAPLPASQAEASHSDVPFTEIPGAEPGATGSTTSGPLDGSPDGPSAGIRSDLRVDDSAMPAQASIKDRSAPSEAAAPTPAPAPAPSLPDEREPRTDTLASKRKTGSVTHDADPSAGRAALHRPLTASPATDEFAKQFAANVGDTPSLLAEGSHMASDALAQTRIDQAKSSSIPAAMAEPTPATVSARPGEIGRQLGVEVARSSLDGRDSLTVRLDPVEFGEIQVRLQFDEKGSLRVHVSAESSAALEMLRRESGDLVRALGEAGLRTDAQSFQFDARGNGRGEQHGQTRHPVAPWRGTEPQLPEDADDQPTRHKLRIGGGSVDLFA